MDCLLFAASAAILRPLLENEQEDRHEHGSGQYQANSVVEGTDQGSMDGLVGGLAGLDARCVRFHHLPADHGADRQGV